MNIVVPFTILRSADLFMIMREPELFIFSDQAFSKKKVEERKEWLTNFMTNRRQRREHNLPEVKSLQT